MNAPDANAVTETSSARARFKDLADKLGVLLIGAAVLAVGVAAIVAFIKGATWASETLLPIFQTLTAICFGLAVFVLLPLAIPKVTRPWAGLGLYITSYVFGATLWMLGFLLTLGTWGVVAVVIGIFFLGVGVVPIAMLAMATHGEWGLFFGLILLLVVMFACRLGGMALVESADG